MRYKGLRGGTVWACGQHDKHAASQRLTFADARKHFDHFEDMERLWKDKLVHDEQMTKTEATCMRIESKGKG